jgi:hypothetical protein
MSSKYEGDSEKGFSPEENPKTDGAKVVVEEVHTPSSGFLGKVRWYPYPAWLFRN